MGKLLIFVGVLLATVIILGLWGYFLKNRQDAKAMGLKGSRKLIAELKATNARQTSVLEEIRELADSSEVVSGDPLWSFVRDKADAALNEKENEK